MQSLPVSKDTIEIKKIESVIILRMLQLNQLEYTCVCVQNLIITEVDKACSCVQKMYSK